MILFTDVHRFFSRLTDWMIQSHSENTRIGQEGKVEVVRVWNIHVPSARVFFYCFQALSMDTPMMKCFGREYFGPIEWSNPMKTYVRKLTTYNGMALKPKNGCSTKEKLAMSKNSMLNVIHFSFITSISLVHKKWFSYSTCPVLLRLSPCIIWDAKS